MLRRFTRLSIINTLSNLTVPITGLVDSAMLGHLDSVHYLAGVVLASLVFDVLYFSLGFLRMATTGLVAQARGRGDAHETRLTLLRALLLAALAGTLLVLLQRPIAELAFRLLNGTAEVEAAGREYFLARIWGAPAVLANLALVGWLLGRERSGHALVVTVVANVCNIILNYWLILHLGWAARGAGWATALAQWLSLGVAVTFAARAGVLWGPSVQDSSGRGLLDRSAWQSLLRLNRDLLVRTLSLTLAFALFTSWSATFGTAVLAANGLVLRILSVGSYFIDGIATATESLSGLFAGGRSLDRLKRLYWLALGVSVILAMVFLVPTTVARHWLYGLLTSHAELVEHAALRHLWLLVILPVAALAYALDGFFLGLTRGRTLRRAMLFSTLVVFCPLGGYAVWSQRESLLWIAFLAFMASRALTLGVSARVFGVYSVPSRGESGPASGGASDGGSGEP